MYNTQSTTLVFPICLLFVAFVVRTLRRKRRLLPALPALQPTMRCSNGCRCLAGSSATQMAHRWSRCRPASSTLLLCSMRDRRRRGNFYFHKHTAPQAHSPALLQYHNRNNYIPSQPPTARHSQPNIATIPQSNIRTARLPATQTTPTQSPCPCSSIIP